MRRISYPQADLDKLILALEMIKDGIQNPKDLKEKYKIDGQTLRLAEILKYLKLIGSKTKAYKLSSKGLKIIESDIDTRKVLFFRELLREDEILPPYAKQIIEQKELHNKYLNTTDVCHKLSIQDLWSGDILNEWFRWLGISIGKTKNEFHLSGDALNKIKIKAFLITIEEEYQRFAGPSNLVPISKLRRELKNCGILCQTDDFDEIFHKICVSPENSSKTSFHPAPKGIVGRGLFGESGKELISINGKLDAPKGAKI